MSNTVVLLRAVYNSLKHILRGLVFTALGAAVELGLPLACLFLLWKTELAEYSWHYQYVALIATTVVLIVGNFLAVALLILYRRKTRERWIRREANNWLASRARQEPPDARRRYARLERRTLWAPTVLVLIVFLFLPETLGLISHAFNGRSMTLGPYRVQTPLTWPIFDHRNSGVALLPGKGIGRVGFGPYLRREELGWSSFQAIPAEERSNVDWYLKYRQILSTQRLGLGKRTFICWNFVPWYEASTVETRASFVDVACRTEDRDFSATFSGERGEAATFYHVLETIRELK